MLMMRSLMFDNNIHYNSQCRVLCLACSSNNVYRSHIIDADIFVISTINTSLWLSRHKYMRGSGQGYSLSGLVSLLGFLAPT